MDKREQDLLEKQMRMCQPPAPGNAALTLVGVAFFAAGLVFGSFLFAPTEGANCSVVQYDFLFAACAEQNKLTGRELSSARVYTCGNVGTEDAYQLNSCRRRPHFITQCKRSSEPSCESETISQNNCHLT